MLLRESYVLQIYKKPVSIKNKVRTGLFVTFFIYAFISLLLFIFVKPLLIFMEQKPSLLEMSAVYIRLETIASIVYTLVQFLLLIFITLKKGYVLLIILLIQANIF